jgi:hypothetical protein
MQVLHERGNINPVNGLVRNTAVAAMLQGSPHLKPSWEDTWRPEDDARSRTGAPPSPPRR